MEKILNDPGVGGFGVGKGVTYYNYGVIKKKKLQALHLLIETVRTK